MHRKARNGSLTVDPGVSESSHILPESIDIATSKRRFSAVKYHKLKDHYKQCVHCQVLVGTFLRKAQREEIADSESATAARENLQRVVHLLHSIVRGDMAPYIDLLEERGAEEANERFPAFAEHLAACVECYDSVEKIRQWLNALPAE